MNHNNTVAVRIGLFDDHIEYLLTHDTKEIDRESVLNDIRSVRTRIIESLIDKSGGELFLSGDDIHLSCLQELIDTLGYTRIVPNDIVILLGEDDLTEKEKSLISDSNAI